MIDPLIAFVLIGCIVAIAFGVAVLPRKLREFRDAVGPNPARQAAAVAQARAEFPSRKEMLQEGWVEVTGQGVHMDSTHYRDQEIQATKRGDLWLAAHYAELAEVAHD